MKVAVSSQGGGLKDKVDPRFGRCSDFIIYDYQTGTQKALPNPSGQSSGGAGIQAAQVLVNMGVNAVLAGRLGPNAFKVLGAAGIEVYGGITGTVEDTLLLFKEKKLELMREANAVSHEGMRGAK